MNAFLDRLGADTLLNSIKWDNILPAWEGLTGSGPVPNSLKPGEVPRYKDGKEGIGFYATGPDGTERRVAITNKQARQQALPSPATAADALQKQVAAGVASDERLSTLEKEIKLRQPQEAQVREHELAKIRASGVEQRLGITETAKGNVSLQESKNKGDAAVVGLQVGGQKYAADRQKEASLGVAGIQLEGNQYNSYLQYLTNDKANDVNLALGNRKYDVETYGIDRQFDSAAADRTLAYYTLDRKTQVDRLNAILNLVGGLGNQYQNAIALGARF